MLEKYAGQKGGGYNHRYNLSDEILIKDTHQSAETNVKRVIKTATQPTTQITVEIEHITH